MTLKVTASLNVDSNIFKHKVSDRGAPYDYYVSVCSVEELSKLGTVRSGGPTYYRKDEASIEYDSIPGAVKGKSEVEEELQILLEQYEQYINKFVGTDTLELEAEDV
jgi:hypothetical protein